MNAMPTSERMRAKVRGMVKRVKTLSNISAMVDPSSTRGDEEEAKKKQKQYRLESNVSVFVGSVETKGEEELNRKARQSNEPTLLPHERFPDNNCFSVFFFPFRLPQSSLTTDATEQARGGWFGGFVVLLLLLRPTERCQPSEQHGPPAQPKHRHVPTLDVPRQLFLSLPGVLYCLFCFDHLLCCLYHCGGSDGQPVCPCWRGRIRVDRCGLC